MRLLANLKTLLVMAVAVAGIASRSDAGTFLFPSVLNPGDKYRLVFVTSTTTDATSPDIGYYNSFVTNVADAVPELLALGATWTVIGSTATVNAIDNIGVSGPDVGIYRLDGAKVADGTAGLFPGPLLVPIDITEAGIFSPGGIGVWTGSDPTGAAAPCSPGYPPCAGAPDLALGRPYVMIGISSDIPSWVAAGGAWPFLPGHLYAISSELTVGGAAPEPTTIGLTALGGAFLLFAMRRKQKDPLAIQADRTPPAHH